MAKKPTASIKQKDEPKKDTQATKDVKEVKKEEKYMVLECPHCGLLMQLFARDRNCGIFRHGFFKSNGDNINPHASLEDCEGLLKSGQITGCGKPFRLNPATQKAEICGYI